MLWKVMGQRAGVAGKSLQIPMQILLPVMAERRKEDWVGRDFVQREFWGLRPANGEPQKNVCLLKETNAGQERLSLSAPTMRSWARESMVSAWTLVDLEGAAATGCQPITHLAGASLLKGDQAPLIAASLPTFSPSSYLSIFYFYLTASFDENADKFITILYSLSFCVFRYYCLLSDPESFLYFLLDVLKSCFSNFSPLIKWVVFGFVSLHGLLNSQCHFLNNSSFLYRCACCLCHTSSLHTHRNLPGGPLFCSTGLFVSFWANTTPL